MSDSNGTKRTTARDRAMDELVANVMLSREELLQAFVVGHDVDEECGYPDPMLLTPEYYRRLYDSDGIANRVCQLMPRESWQGRPKIYESEDDEETTDFEEAWDEMCNALNPVSKSWHGAEEGSPLWEYLIRADILSGIGQFGVLLLGLDDGLNLQDPTDGVEVLTANSWINSPRGAMRAVEWLPDSAIHHSEVEAIGTFNREHPVVNSGTEDAVQRRMGRAINRETEAIIWVGWPNGSRPCWAVVNRRTGALIGRVNGPALTANAVKGKGFSATKPPKTQSIRKDSYGPYKLGGGGAPGDGPFVQGTDKSYSQGYGLGMPAPQYPGGVDTRIGGATGGVAPALSGTDQQYFGVQFGPSETFGDPGKKPRRLLFLRSFDESLVQVVRYEWNIRNPRFGLPVMYRITLNDPRQPHSGVGLPLATVYVHWSRLTHLADNLHASEIFGVPRMRPVINQILNIRKLLGSSAEGYWKSCFTTMSFETHPALGGDVPVDVAGLRQMYTDYQARLQRAFYLTGMSAKSIAPSVVDPSPHVDKQTEAICVQLGCPVRVFKGSERGELASSQDDEAWNERKGERRHLYITPKVIVPFVDRLIQIGVLPEPDMKKNGGYHAFWPDLDALGDKDKAGIALQKTQAMAQYVSGNVEQLMAPPDYLMRVLDMEREVVEEMQDEVERKQEEEQQEAQDLADEHGFEPEAPEGFTKPKPAPVIAPGMGGGSAGGMGGGMKGQPPQPTPQQQQGQAMKAAKAEGEEPPKPTSNVSVYEVERHLEGEKPAANELTANKSDEVCEAARSLLRGSR
jgi:hypothetical protein